MLLERSTKEIMVYGCKGNRMLLEHERDYGFGMDVKVITVCSWNTKEIMVWAWM